MWTQSRQHRCSASKAHFYHSTKEPKASPELSVVSAANFQPPKQSISSPKPTLSTQTHLQQPNQTSTSKLSIFLGWSQESRYSTFDMSFCWRLMVRGQPVGFRVSRWNVERRCALASISEPLPSQGCKAKTLRHPCYSHAS